MASQREAGRQLQQAQQAFDGERAHLEQQVRRSIEEGSVRIQTLEDTIRKLGNRSDLHQVGSSCLSRHGEKCGVLLESLFTLARWLSGEYTFT